MSSEPGEPTDRAARASGMIGSMRSLLWSQAFGLAHRHVAGKADFDPLRRQFLALILPEVGHQPGGISEVGVLQKDGRQGSPIISIDNLVQTILAERQAIKIPHQFDLRGLGR